MKPIGASSSRLAYKWLSLCLVLLFVYYWLITLGLVFFGSSVSASFPNQSFIYRGFARQNWRLFAITKVYNRQMLFITRDPANPSKSDTTDLVQYLLAEKRAYAPFNNKQDAHDRILYIVMNGVEARVHYQKNKLKATMPGKPELFYHLQAIEFVKNDSAHQQDIDNIVGFAKMILQQSKQESKGKEYQLIIKHSYIPPAKPVLVTEPGSNDQVLFKSDFKPL